MRKVKIFNGWNISSLEMEINNWMEENYSKMNDLFITQSTIAAENNEDEGNIIISIWYEDTK